MFSVLSLALFPAPSKTSPKTSAFFRSSFFGLSAWAVTVKQPFLSWNLGGRMLLPWSVRLLRGLRP